MQTNTPHTPHTRRRVQYIHIHCNDSLTHPHTHTCSRPFTNGQGSRKHFRSINFAFSFGAGNECVCGCAEGHTYVMWSIELTKGR